jgi:hypothetical protein
LRHKRCHDVPQAGVENHRMVLTVHVQVIVIVAVGRPFLLDGGLTL